MTTIPVPTRFSETELATIDELVAEGVGENRSEVIRLAVDDLADRVRRLKIGRAIAESYRLQPQSEAEIAAAYAIAVATVEAEPW